MRIIFLLTLFLSFYRGVYCQPGNPPLSISHLTGDFYIFTTYKVYDGAPYPANGMYLRTTKGVILFDAPWDSTQFQPLVDSIQKNHHQKIIMCIATHFHEDRTGGLDFFKQAGARTYTSYKTDELSKQTGKQRAETLFYNDTVFNIGGHRFQTYYGGPGHSPDNIVIWFAKEKILYGGCLVKSVETNDLGNLSDANVAAWPLTIQKIQHKFGQPLFIIPGHQSWTSKNALQHTLELINQQKK
ncbi:MAG: BlaB/IND/MUS family subclass B1 metallo-beta-lactamase [Agriterribacter sp.]